MKKKDAIEKENMELDEKQLKKQQKKKKASSVAFGVFWTLLVLCGGIMIGVHWKVILKKIKGEEDPEDCGCPVYKGRLSDSVKSAGELIAGSELLKSAGDLLENKNVLKDALEAAELKKLKDLIDIRKVLNRIGK